MKVIRVPWIRCRADEADAQGYEIEWRNRGVTILAYSEREARDWWEGLGTAERNELLGIGSEDETQASFF